MLEIREGRKKIIHNLITFCLQSYVCPHDDFCKQFIVSDAVPSVCRASVLCEFLSLRLTSSKASLVLGSCYFLNSAGPRLLGFPDSENNT